MTAGGRPLPPGRSIRRTLTLWLMVPLVALVPLSAALLYTIAVRPAEESLDHVLAGTVLAVSERIRSDATGVHVDLSAQTDAALRADRFDRIFYVVIAPDGRTLAGDRELAETRPPDALRGDWQLFDAQVRDVPVRVVAHRLACSASSPPGERPCEVRAAETLIKRATAKRDVLAGAVLSIVPISLLLVLMGWKAIARGLAPLEQLSAEIESRSLGNLNAMQDIAIPREVAPLVAAINRLFERVRAASVAERAFLADAAHQLRTPLTGLRTEAELALLEPYPPQIESVLKRLHAGATRAARLAQQLLAQARADHEAHNAPIDLIDLKQLATEAVDESVGRALPAGIDLGFELQSAPVKGRHHLLRELLSNLLDNALQYAGSGARVTVRTFVESGCSVLEIDDNGPGIPLKDRSRVLERFQRGAQDRGVGSGLGLSIVRDVAQHHQASIDLLDGQSGSGLLVRVRFPLGTAA